MQKPLQLPLLGMATASAPRNFTDCYNAKFHHVVARSKVLLCIIMKIMLTIYFFKYIPHYYCWKPWQFRSHCTPLLEKAQMTGVIITELLLLKCFQYFSWKGIFSL